MTNTPARWSNARWTAYFEGNRDHFADLPWDQCTDLADVERRAVADSIATFQLGESSEGRHFVALATVYADATGDHDYLAALKLFIGEEQKHAEVLGRFMDDQGLPRLSHQWTDTAFRILRRLFNLELEISVLLTAELVAKQYYRALRDATDNEALRRICRQILRDEALHIHFQAAMLGRLRRHRSRARRDDQDRVHGLFYRAVLLIVWLGHGSVYRRAGYSFPVFWRRSLRELLWAHRSAAIQAEAPEAARHDEGAARGRNAARSGGPGLQPGKSTGTACAPSWAARALQR